MTCLAVGQRPAMRPQVRLRQRRRLSSTGAHAVVARIRPGALLFASAVGTALGLAVGGSVVSWETTTGALVVQGFVSGAALGVAQAAVLWPVVGRWTGIWPPLTAAAWALGWWTTSAAGIDVERHYAVFGASGALVATALTGLAAVPAIRTRARVNG